MITRLYAWLAGLAIIIAVVAAIYGKGRLDAAHAKEIEALRVDLRTAELVLQKERAARQQDAILATEAAKRHAALKHKIDELDAYVDTLEDRDRQCLSGADTERLRLLWD